MSLKTRIAKLEEGRTGADPVIVHVGSDGTRHAGVGWDAPPGAVGVEVDGRFMPYEKFAELNGDQWFIGWDDEVKT